MPRNLAVDAEIAKATNKDILSPDVAETKSLRKLVAHGIGMAPLCDWLDALQLVVVGTMEAVEGEVSDDLLVVYFSEFVATNVVCSVAAIGRLFGGWRKLLEPGRA